MCMIGRNSGGTSEQIVDGQTGLLYDGTISDLYNKIEYLYLNRNDMEKMAKKSYKFALKNFTNGYPAKVSERIIDNIL